MPLRGVQKRHGRIDERKKKCHLDAGSTPRAHDPRIPCTVTSGMKRNAGERPPSPRDAPNAVRQNALFYDDPRGFPACTPHPSRHRPPRRRRITGTRPTSVWEHKPRIPGGIASAHVASSTLGGERRAITNCGRIIVGMWVEKLGNFSSYLETLSCSQVCGRGMEGR